MINSSYNRSLRPNKNDTTKNHFANRPEAKNKLINSALTRYNLAGNFFCSSAFNRTFI